METIEEILEELRSGEFAPLADRIEAAHKQSVTDCNQPVTDCHALNEAVKREVGISKMETTTGNETVADVIDELDNFAEDYSKCDDALPLLYIGLKAVVARLRRAHGKEVYEWYKANREEDSSKMETPTGCDLSSIIYGSRINGDRAKSKADVKLDLTSQQSLNMAKAREALKRVEKLAREFDCGNYYINEFPKMLLDAVQPALTEPPRNCDIMSLETARKVWFIKEITPRLNGDLPLGKEVPFEEWFVSQQAKGGVE